MLTGPWLRGFSRGFALSMALVAWNWKRKMGRRKPASSGGRRMWSCPPYVDTSLMMEANEVFN